MHLQIAFAVCVLVTATSADTKFPDGTYVQHFTPPANSLTTTNHLPAHLHHPHGFGVQSGYEGFLVPTKSAPQSGWGWHHIAGILPLAKLAIKFPFTSGFWAVGLLTLLIGGSLLCSFTPVCGFSLLGLGRTYLNHDSLNSATAFVMDAIEKHRDLQKKPVAKETKVTKETKETKEE